MKKLIGCLLVCLSFSSFAVTEVDPSTYLKEIADKMIAAVEANKAALKTDDKLAKNLVEKYLLPVIDQQTFANRTLGSSVWDSMSKAQQDAFIKGYISRVIDKYAKGLSLYDGQAFVFEKSEISEKSGNARVRSAMHQSGSEPLDIDYHLSPENGKWLITNIIVAGTDMRKSYKQQFMPRINEIGMDKFIEEISLPE